MKKITLLFSFLLCLSIAIAQDGSEVSNKFILGGSIGFSTQQNGLPFSSVGNSSNVIATYTSPNDESRRTSISFSPYLGREINPKVIWGVNLHLRYNYYGDRDYIFPSEPEPDLFEITTHQFGLGVFMRYTFNPTHKFNLFMQPFIEYNSSKREQYFKNESTFKETSQFMNVGLVVGGLYNINEKFRATLRAGILSLLNGTWKEEYINREGNFTALSANLNLSSLRFGFEMRI